MLATGNFAAAQEFRATIRWQVLDPSGGVLPGTTVTVTNVETDEVATATTNDKAARRFRSCALARTRSPRSFEDLL